MSEAFDTSRPQAISGGFRVVAPCAGDVLSGALHRAYDDHCDVPADLLSLLAQLDQVETQRW